MSENAERSISTSSSLLSRLKKPDDQEGWRRFFSTYGRLIREVALKAGLNESEAEDVVQETAVSVARNIREFRYDPTVCLFKTWLLRATRWRILDHLRARQREQQWRVEPATAESAQALMEEVADPAASRVEEVWEEAWRRNLLKAALERVKEMVRPIHYQIFDLTEFQDWPVEEVKAKLRVSAAQVYVARYRLKRLLRKEIRKLEKGSGIE